jgi:hypothetical protein
MVDSTASTSTAETGAVAASLTDMLDEAAGAGVLAAAAEAGADAGAAAAA